jgi:hypothetical protein
VGQRANLIVVEGGVYQLFYSHWCANTLHRDLFWGPEHALAFIRIQRPVVVSGWLDNVWAEGGALIDLDSRNFVLYGGEDVLYDMPLRRVYLELLAKTWAGWMVHWAYEGIAELADYVGYPRDKVLTKPVCESSVFELNPPEQRDWTNLVASVCFQDGTIRIFPLAGDLAAYLASGPKLADNVPRSGGLDRLNLDEWTKEFPGGGFHLELSARRLDFWAARDVPGLEECVTRDWSGWVVCWHRDVYEAQLERTEGLLCFPIPDREELLERCRQILLLDRPASPVDIVKRLIEQGRAEGRDVHVNPWALRDDRLELSREKRIAILTSAMMSR